MLGESRILSPAERPCWSTVLTDRRPLTPSRSLRNDRRRRLHRCPPTRRSLRRRHQILRRTIGSDVERVANERRERPPLILRRPLPTRQRRLVRAGQVTVLGHPRKISPLGEKDIVLAVRAGQVISPLAALFTARSTGGGGGKELFHRAASRDARARPWELAGWTARRILERLGSDGSARMARARLAEPAWAKGLRRDPLANP